VEHRPILEQTIHQYLEEKMKKLASVSWMVLLVVLMTACQFPGTKIKPGDKIGDMEFVSDYESCPAPNFSDICGFDALADGTCEIPASMTQFWISIGWAEDTQEALELAWLDSEWNMTFDGYNVNLSSFGTFDMDLEGQKARTWNVCISNPPVGKHTVVYLYSFENGSRPGNHTSALTFTVLAAESP